LGFNAATGRLDRETVEQSVDLSRVVTITDEKRESLRGFFLNGGLTWDRGGRFAAGLAFRSPYRRKAAARSLFRYEVSREGTDIRIDAEGTNIYRQPWVLGAGGSYRFSEHWSAIAGLAWIGWSGYEVELYGEPAERRFRDAVRAGAGIEFLVPARSRPRAVRVPLRLGISYDPQPMTDPRSAYLSITFGAGLKWLGLAVDLSASVGGERGSGSGLTSGRAVLGVRYALSR
jgi:long-subunit fatty acid transport protein